jgi:hypothetical protein
MQPSFARVISSWSVISLLAFAITSWVGLEFWWALSMVASTMLLNSIIAGIEDRMPAGSPQPTRKTS